MANPLEKLLRDGEGRVLRRMQQVVKDVSDIEEDYEHLTDEEIRTDPTPAYQAGIRPGDRVVSFNGVEAESWKQVQQLIRDNGNGLAEIVVERDGELMTIEAETTVTPRFLTADAEEPEPVGFLGISPRKIQYKLHEYTSSPPGVRREGGDEGA